MRRLASFLVGLLIGGLVGGTLALLFAPASGKQFQQQIAETIDRLSGEVRTAAEQRRKELEEELNRLRQGRIQLE
ncbi:MAG: YtxH domain-containing protein [Bellilinea sp.]|nr:YtxH domain-containing protein [Bellilinea sp.]